MSLPIYQRVAVTDAGDVIPGAEYTVINENTGVAAPIYSDRTGATLLTAPYFADSAGTIQFFIAQGTTFRVAASGGVGTYTDRYVYGVAEAVLVQADGTVNIGGLGSNDGNIALKRSSDNLTVGNVTVDSGGSRFVMGTAYSNIDFFTEQTNFGMRIKNGNVGIGTSSPISALEVSVGVTQAIADTGDAVDVLTITAAEEDAPNLVAGNGPALKFKIPGNNNTSYDGARIAAHKARSSDSENATDLTFSTNANLDNSESLTERMRIDYLGNVGIGTNSPAKKVEIAGNNQALASNTTLRFTDTDTATQTDQHFGKIEFNSLDSSAVSPYRAYITAASENSLAGSYISFGTSAFTAAVSEKLRIDGTGNVGIGTSSPTEQLSLYSNAGNAIQVQSHSSTAGSYRQAALKFALSASGSSTLNWDITAEQSALTFDYEGSEKMRLDSSGNLFVGKTSTTESVEGIELRADGQLKAIVSSNYAATFRRNDTDGDIVEFLTNSNTAGSIATSGGSLTIGSGDVGLLFVSSVDTIIPWNTLYNGQRDNAIDLGNSNNRFNDAYITNGVTAGSDRTLKQDILEITTAETAVAKACKSLLRSFRWKDAVIEKGDDARIHFGIIAQDLRDAFTAQGLDAGRYAMFMSDTWWETQTEVEAVEAAEAIEGVEFVQAVEASEAVEAVYGEDGEIISEAIEAVEAVEGVECVEAVEAVEAKDAYTRTDTFQTLAEAPEGATERTRLGVRYTELLAFIISAI